ncbi:conserved domain protein [Actinomyces sp. oral taxon 170 str. F0386]|nr:conserved domain protein [Actinomyces sp. oral taxon 170 str. F0386]
MTVYDTDGKNKMDKSNGCVFSATQNLFDTSAKGDRTQSEHRADSILDSYKTSSHLSNVSTEPARDDSALVKDTDGNAIETRRVDMTYTGEDQKDYRLTGFVRVFTTTSTPVLLQGMYACPVDAYSSSEMEELLEATPISHPGPADMDESESGSGSGKDGRSDGKKSGSDDGKATAPSGRSDEKSSGRSSKDT